MNLKRLILFLFVLILIAIIVIFLLTKCEPRVRPPEDEENTTITDDIGDDDTITQPEDLDLAQYRTPFINANINFTCQIKSDPDLADNPPVFKSQLDKAYETHELPIENDSLMLEILDLYNDDQSVISEVRDGSQECPEE